jgi:hypothetical protein
MNQAPYIPPGSTAFWRFGANRASRRGVINDLLGGDSARIIGAPALAFDGVNDNLSFSPAMGCPPGTFEVAAWCYFETASINLVVAEDSSGRWVGLEEGAPTWYDAGGETITLPVQSIPVQKWVLLRWRITQGMPATLEFNLNDQPTVSGQGAASLGSIAYCGGLLAGRMAAWMLCYPALSDDDVQRLLRDPDYIPADALPHFTMNEASGNTLLANDGTEATTAAVGGATWHFEDNLGNTYKNIIGAPGDSFESGGLSMVDSAHINGGTPASLAVGTDDFTIWGVFQLASIPALPELRLLSSTPSSSAKGIKVYMTSGGSLWFIISNGGGTQKYTSVAASGNYTQPFLVAVVKEGDALRGHFIGATTGQQAASTSGVSTYDPTSIYDFYIGTQRTNSGDAHDPVRIYAAGAVKGRALPANELQQLLKQEAHI